MVRKKRMDINITTMSVSQQVSDIISMLTEHFKMEYFKKTGKVINFITNDTMLIILRLINIPDFKIPELQIDEHDKIMEEMIKNAQNK